MSWKSIGVPISTAENTAKSISQEFIPESNTILRGMVAGLIFYGNPVFTSIQMFLYSGNSYLATSTKSFNKLDILTLEHGYRILGFEFEPYKLKAGNDYRAVLLLNGYTGNSTSHIAWRKSYPDPQYRTGITLTCEKGAKYPLELSLVTVKE
jgi:hypothetical protein